MIRLAKIRFIIPINNKDKDLSNCILSRVELRYPDGSFAGRETFVFLGSIHKNLKYYEVDGVLKD